ncbi:MAG TPA: hypothetical protein VHO94_06605 [Oscillospiraceae bacterium]|nr:hypothetical protein [Oscillospiraceae bacterium]
MAGETKMPGFSDYAAELSALHAPLWNYFDLLHLIFANRSRYLIFVKVTAFFTLTL